MCLFQETVRLVRVRQVGRSNHHVLHLLGQYAQHGSRCGACRAVGLLLHGAPVHLRSLFREEQLQLGCFFRIGFCPFGFYGILLGYDFFQFGRAFGIQFFDFGEDDKRVFRVSAQILDSIDISFSAQGCSMRGATCFIAASIGPSGAFAHDGVPDDKGRAFRFGLRFIQRPADGIRVIAVDGDDFPSPCFVFLGCIFVRDSFGFGRQLDVVRIIKHDEVVQAQSPGDASRSLRDFFLYASVGDIRIDGLRHYFRETGFQELGGDGGPYGKRMSLS